MTLRLSGGRRLQSPPGQRARPTSARVRQAVLNMLAPRLPGCRWLDLCCGSGIMTCEVLQRGAAEVVGVEQDRRVAQVARANLTAVAGGLEDGQGRWQLHAKDMLRWLKQTPDQAGGVSPFDLIYCDPPYNSGFYNPVAEAVAAGGWLASEGLMLWECATASQPLVPQHWMLEDQRRYGSTTVMVLSYRAGCPGDTGSRQQ